MPDNGYPKGWGKVTTARKAEANNICELCGEPPPNGQEHTLQTHHLDHNRKNLDPENLIVVCQRCHERLQRWKITMGKTAFLAEIEKVKSDINYQPHIY